MKRGKKYQEALKKYDRVKLYTMDEAVSKVKEMAFAKFDEAVEVSVNLNLKKSHTIRDTLVLPNQFAEGKKILVFAKGDKAQEAKDAGAAFVGDSDLIDKIKGGWLDFDVAVATPDMMKDVGRLGPILGRRGLMPNPKTQTVTTDVKGAIAQLQQGRVEFRADKGGIVHLLIGKVSMDAEKIVENVRTFVTELEKRRPTDLKGDYIKTIALSSTMGPGVKVQVKDN
ncbi:50S ribosomal protein L1 [Spirochaeta cellobiosiphila]|uniref:50S ribosomal protein L1 n=1 Tax=Spirochaeta cellobiosiphila TaxID=504483 RepID=UPI0004085F81|nr:50S ribosomal protein L1 [Spirochaeta cellobiosiphila]